MYVNVKQGHTDKGHVCFLAQINKASVFPAVSPLRIGTCLSGLLVPKSRSLLLSPNTSVSILMMFTNGIGCPLTEMGLDQLMVISTEALPRLQMY